MNARPLRSDYTRSWEVSVKPSSGDPGLHKFAERISRNVERDVLIQKTTNEIREFLAVDRVVVYYFYLKWQGRVIFESLSSKEYSIFGSTGADDCFNQEYAALYQAGRVRAIADIQSAEIHPCHREFLGSIKVCANLVVPIINTKRLWGLLIAHHCQNTYNWEESDIEIMQKAATVLASSPAIRNS